MQQAAPVRAPSWQLFQSQIHTETNLLIDSKIQDCEVTTVFHQVEKEAEGLLQNPHDPAAVIATARRIIALAGKGISRPGAPGKEVAPMSYSDVMLPFREKAPPRASVKPMCKRLWSAERGYLLKLTAKVPPDRIPKAIARKLEDLDRWIARCDL